MHPFDLAYIQFADALGIDCLHFILHDQIENVHDNQISSLLPEIVSEVNCQYVLPVLRDKLPEDIDVDQGRKEILFPFRTDIGGTRPGVETIHHNCFGGFNGVVAKEPHQNYLIRVPKIVGIDMTPAAGMCVFDNDPCCLSLVIGHIPNLLFQGFITHSSGAEYNLALHHKRDCFLLAIPSATNEE
ncbi:MAG: DUF2326 domain-containing protein [bacterium]|nr:DUF2326 domain-containing protein [bacterium]